MRQLIPDFTEDAWPWVPQTGASLLLSLLVAELGEDGWTSSSSVALLLLWAEQSNRGQVKVLITPPAPRCNILRSTGSYKHTRRSSDLTLIWSSRAIFCGGLEFSLLWRSPWPVLPFRAGEGKRTATLHKATASDLHRVQFKGLGLLCWTAMRTLLFREKR